MSGTDLNEGSAEGFPDVCGVVVRCCRPLSGAVGEALLVATEDLSRLVLKQDWSQQDCAQMRDLARHALVIINSLSTPPSR